jgi:hypothetical protein
MVGVGILGVVAVVMAVGWAEETKLIENHTNTFTPSLAAWTSLESHCPQFA